MPVTPCAPVAPVCGVVTYDATEFLTSYPEFTGIYLTSPQMLASDFVGATMLLNNSCGSRVRDANQRMYLLYLLTAHIATIFQGVNDAGVSAPAFAGTAAIAGSVLAVASVSAGALAVGSSLYDGPGIGGNLIVPGSVIVSSLGTGTGGIGSYNLTQTLGTVALEDMIVLGVPNVQAPLGIVGRVNNASQGDVSVASEYQAPPNASMAWFIQTKYGAQYWAMTAKYRTFIGLPASPDNYSPLGGLTGPWGGGPWNG